MYHETWQSRDELKIIFHSAVCIFLLSRFQKIFRIMFRFQFLMNPKVLFISQVILNAQKKTDTILEMPRLEVVIIASRIINKKPFGHVYVSYSAAGQTAWLNLFVGAHRYPRVNTGWKNWHIFPNSTVNARLFSYFNIIRLRNEFCICVYIFGLDISTLN